ncbi:hypothetical protein NA57DRAFT_78010 [Rhizodiscina lignyota]|uniref:WW domain-containing protein n=1 Tax=Rhizodiscina lignyota TaxID=1504668 RepID=A0A9P4I9B1_9PEZI|nr:hypothetical protein NA57DRAFT_78010 [Rhizodiscina lignyota]
MASMASAGVLLHSAAQSPVPMSGTPTPSIHSPIPIPPGEADLEPVELEGSMFGELPGHYGSFGQSPAPPRPTSTVHASPATPQDHPPMPPASQAQSLVYHEDQYLQHVQYATAPQPATQPTQYSVPQPHHAQLPSPSPSQMTFQSQQSTNMGTQHQHQHQQNQYQQPSTHQYHPSISSSLYGAQPGQPATGMSQPHPQHHMQHHQSIHQNVAPTSQTPNPLFQAQAQQYTYANPGAQTLQQPVTVNPSTQSVIRPTTPGVHLQNGQLQQVQHPSLPAGHMATNGQVLMQQPTTAGGVAQSPHNVQHPQPHPAMAHTNHQGQHSQGSHIPLSVNQHGHPVHPTQHFHPTPGHIGNGHPTAPAMASIPQLQQHSMPQQVPQQMVHQQPIQTGKPPKKQKLPKLPKLPKPSKSSHRTSISGMSIASSVSSLSTTPDGGIVSPMSPPTYTPTPVIQQPQPQAHAQVPVQVVQQHPQQNMSGVAAKMSGIVYHWYCSKCEAGLSTKNVYFECLICSSADIHSKLCQACYLQGCASNSPPLSHDKTYYISNQDPTLTNDTSIPPQKWTIRRNQFGRIWYQSCTAPVKTHVRPMTAAIPNHSGWIEAKNPNGQIFWVSTVTGQTSGNRPTTGMPKGWREVRTPEGRPFYVNDALELATWVYPGHQPPHNLQTGQHADANVANAMHAQVQVQVQSGNATAPQLVHAPQPLKVGPVNGAVTIHNTVTRPPVAGSVQVTATVMKPQKKKKDKTDSEAKAELKKAGKQAGLAMASGAITGTLKGMGVDSKFAKGISQGVVGMGRAGVRVAKQHMDQQHHQYHQHHHQQPTADDTSSDSDDSSDDGQVIFTPDSPPQGLAAQQVQGQYFVDMSGQGQQQPQSLNQQFQTLQISSDPNASGNAQQTTDNANISIQGDVTLGAAFAGPVDPLSLTQDNTYIVDNSTSIQIDQSQYVDMSSVQVDSSQFNGIASGPVPTDLSGFTTVDASSMSVVDASGSVADGSVSVDAYQAYATQVDVGESNSQGLIDGDVEVDEVDVDVDVDVDCYDSSAGLF